jgi:hypothetical protein
VAGETPAAAAPVEDELLALRRIALYLFGDFLDGFGLGRRR